MVKLKNKNNITPENLKILTSLAISCRNSVYLSPRFRKGDEGDWLDGVEDDFESGFMARNKMLEEIVLRHKQLNSSNMLVLLDAWRELVNEIEKFREE